MSSSAAATLLVVLIAVGGCPADADPGDPAASDPASSAPAASDPAASDPAAADPVPADGSVSAASASAAPGPALPDVWEARLADLADPARPHVARWGSVQAFGRLDAGDPLRPDLAARLAELLGGDDARYYVVRALGLLGEAASADALLPWLADEQWSQRRYAALALEQIDAATPAVVEGLEAALADPMPAVRDQARRSLGRLDPAATRPALDRWYLDGRSTGLAVAVTSPAAACWSDGGACRLELTLTNGTDHAIELPPLVLTLERGLYLRDAAGRASWPWAGDEHRGGGGDLDPVRIEAGASAEVHLRLELEPFRGGLPVDHTFVAAPDRWALRVGQIRYLLHPDNNAGGPLDVRVVLHPAYVAELTGHLPRAAAYWTGKAVAESDVSLVLPPLPDPESP